MKSPETLLEKCIETRFLKVLRFLEDLNSKKTAYKAVVFVIWSFPKHFQAHKSHVRCFAILQNIFSN